MYIVAALLRFQPSRPGYRPNKLLRYISSGPIWGPAYPPRGVFLVTLVPILADGGRQREERRLPVESLAPVPPNCRSNENAADRGDRQINNGYY